ncbi:sulfite exporter TauE/SafE family protein [Mycolicibacterium pulveris]|uniref:sulfite exporter TauE/SafE family protein n=1 Tax=Mycolicibacterium pulveris TaxID=36813 RepID=UPI003CECAC0F
MNWALLFAAGVVGGLTGSIAGLASVATYPALLVAGLPPVTANVTNTVALVFNGVGSVLGSRPELRGQGRWLLRMTPLAALAGAIGALLLLSTPPGDFERLVPVLLGVASLAILLPRSGKPEAPAANGRRRRARTVFEAGAIFLISIYSGYFGAASGVLLLALLLRIGHATLAHANASKNFLLGVANLVAAVVFALVAPVQWWAVVPLGLGCLIGSRLGPVVVRHSPAGPMRALIGVAGLAVTVKLALDTYG